MGLSNRHRQWSWRAVRLSLRQWFSTVLIIALLLYIAVGISRPVLIQTLCLDGKNEAARFERIRERDFNATRFEKIREPAITIGQIEQLHNDKNLAQPPDSNETQSDTSVDTQAADDNKFDNFLKQPVIYFHNFSYIHNLPDACRKPGVDVIIVTPSAPANFARRRKSRQASEGFVVKPQNKAIHLFFLASTKDSDVQASVDAEFQRHRDIVQENFLDVYKNVSLKAVMMLKWVTTFCPEAGSVIRLDDDISINIDGLLTAINWARHVAPYFIVGDVKEGWKTNRDKRNSAYTTREEYAPEFLPTFALGGALGYTPSSMKRLYEASKRVKRFWLDDVYITGMCAPAVGVKLLDGKEFHFSH